MLKEYVLTTDGRRIANGITPLCGYLGVSNRTVLNWIRNGKLNGCYSRSGVRYVFDLDEIDKQIKPINKLNLRWIIWDQRKKKWYDKDI